MINKIFWLSFCDPARPEGQQLLGVAVVEVTPDDIRDALLVKPELLLRDPDVKALAGAIHKAWQTGCNPGGQVASYDITDAPAERLTAFPRHTLLTRSQVDTIQAGLA